MRQRFLPVLCVCLLLSAPVLTQVVRPEFITIDHGLSQGMIFDLLQTRDGFLWIATKNGLNRYDGYNFKVYDNSPSDPFSLAESNATYLFEDSRGLVWVGLLSKGLNLFDRRTERFYHFNLTIDGAGNQGEFGVTSISESPDGAIWVTQSTNGVFRIKIPSSWPYKMPDNPELDPLVAITPLVFPVLPNTGQQSPENFKTVSRFNDSLMLVGSNARIYTARVSDLRAKIFQQLPGNAPANRDANTALSANGVSWLLVDNKISRPGGGTEFDLQLPRYNNKLIDDRAGHTWLISDEKVWKLSPGKSPPFERPVFEIDKFVTAILEDRSGNVWVGTNGYGLRKFNPLTKLFHKGAEGTSINGIWENAKGELYLKTTARISKYNHRTRQLEKNSPFPDATGMHTAITFAPNGDLWLLHTPDSKDTIAELRCYDPGKKLKGVYRFPHQYSFIDVLFYDPSGDIWIGDSGCRIIQFNLRSYRFKSYSFATLFGENAKAIKISAITRDGKGLLWIGTQEGLVNGKINGSGIDFQLIRSDASHKGQLLSNNISCLLPDPEAPSGLLWIGTKGGGINRLDLINGQFSYITTAEGLPNNVVYGILPDDNSGIWCSTNRGLVRWSKKTGKAMIYTAADGLQNNEFNSNAFQKAPSGALLFGGVGGFNRFFPADLNIPSPAPPVFIVGLEINHKPVQFGQKDNPLTLPLEYLQEIKLGYDQNNLSFEFAALDFSSPAKNRYKYQLAGIDHDWVDAGENHFAHYTHLPPGKYVFRVMGSNGNWNEKPVELTVVIRPPWWRSALAYLIYTLLAGFLIWMTYRLQTNRIRLREQLSYEQRETERIKALEQMKTDFFSNVTHEFRTPLTLMLEPLRQLLQQPADYAQLEKLRMVDRNSKRLLTMVNQLLDLAKLEHGGLSPDLHAGNIAETAHNVFLPFLPAAEKKGVRFLYSAARDIPLFLYDQHKVELVLNNLLSNALKFTENGGEVKLEVTKQETAPNFIRLSVYDTGVGIAPEKHGKIFERFYQVDGSPNNTSGTGIGLALSKELAELMGGRITVESAVGKGAVFHFSLPCIRTNSVPDQPASPDVLAEEANPVEILGQNDKPVVLLVEDNPDLRSLIRASLAGVWQIVEASNGAEGVRRAGEIIPDIVITDVMMPEKDGYAVCAEIKSNELTAHIPVILLTAKSALDAKIKGLRLGADEYLTKPFSTEELLARMHNLVETRRKLRNLYGQTALPEAPTYADKPFLSAPDNEFMRRFTRTLEENLDNPDLSIEDFAGKLFISRVQLHRKLKGITDKNATDFIRDYRLERAMALLKNREGRVGEIAARVGFHNEKYFSTVFKEKFGLSPSQV